MTGFVKSFTSTRQWSIDILFVLALILTSGPEAGAQVLQPARFEFPVFHHDPDFEIIPAGTKGLFLQRTFSGVKEDQLQVVKLDTAFQQQWGGFMSVDKNYNVVGRKVHRDNLYLLLRYKDYTRNDLLLYAIDDDDGKYKGYIIKSFIPFTPSEFQIAGKSVLIGGYYNKVPVVLHFSTITNKSKVLPGLFNESGELTQIRVNPDNTFDVVIGAQTIARKRTLWIKNYDPDGNLLRNAALEPEENKHLIFGRAVKSGNDMQIVAGVFGNRSSEYSRGIFMASIDPSGMQQLRYYNFADLRNFFKYMKAGREQRIKNRIERKKIKGKKIRFNYRFLVHELIPYNDHYILLGEAFYPRYTNMERGYAGFFNPYFSNRPMIHNGRIFDGYYYTHAVVMCFDKQGNLVWDNSFEIMDVKTFTLEQFVKLEVQGDKITLLYLFENEIRTKIIKGDEVLEGKTRDMIKTLNENEVVRKESSEDSTLEYWYPDYLFASGVQEIVNPVSKGRRRVFYINKVTFSR